MSEEQKPKQRWFQFHLLTLVLIVLAMGAVLCLNARKHVRFDFRFKKDLGYIEYGWPFTAYSEDAAVIPPEEIPALPVKVQSEALVLNEWDKFYLKDVGIVVGDSESKSVVAVGLIVDLLCLFAILGSTAILSEYLIRRREGRKP